jgi:hypothetical protein
VGTAAKSGLCESGELADEQIASSSALWQKRSVADVLMEILPEGCPKVKFRLVPKWGLPEIRSLFMG